MASTSNQQDKGDRAQKKKTGSGGAKRSQEAKTGITDGYNKTEPSILPNVYHQEDAKILRAIRISSSSESDED